MNEKEIFNALIESFKQQPPRNWSFEECAAGRLKTLGLTSAIDRFAMARALGIEDGEGFKLYYAFYTIEGSGPVVPWEIVSRSLISVLEEARDTGKVNWPTR
jgi:hypothetical protein